MLKHSRRTHERMFLNPWGGEDIFRQDLETVDPRKESEPALVSPRTTQDRCLSFSGAWSV